MGEERRIVEVESPSAKKEKVEVRCRKYLEGVKGAAEDEKAVVAQRRHHPQSGQVADQVYLADTGVVIDHLRRHKASLWLYIDNANELSPML